MLGLFPEESESCMKSAEIRNLTGEEINLKLREKESELYKTRQQVKSGQLKKHRRIRSIKKDIARIKTIIRESEIKK